MILYASDEGHDDGPMPPDGPPGSTWGEQLVRAFEQVLKPRARGDLATFLIHGFFAPSRGGIRLQAGPALLPQVLRAAAEVGAGHLQVLCGHDGWQALTRLGEDICAMMRQIAEKHDRAFWYALLVRAERVLIPALPLTGKQSLPAIYDSVFRSPRRSTLVGFLTAPWRVPPKVLTDLDQLIWLGLVLNNVNVARYRIGKGQQVALDHLQILSPRYDPDSVVAQAIDLYDSRDAGIGTAAAATLGSVGATVGPLDRGWPAVVWASLYFQEPMQGPVLADLLTRWDPVFPMVADLRALVPAVFLPGSGGLTLPAQALIVFIQAFSDLVLAKAAARRWSRRAWSRFGYAVRSRREFQRAFHAAAAGHRILEHGWVDGDADAALGLLIEYRVLMPVGRHVIINGAVATGLLHNAFHRPAEGKAANVWADSFEAEVQTLIDSTRWQLPDEFRPLVKEVVKVGGKTVTDLDAVGYHDGVLLLVDCKAYKGAERLFAGEYSAFKSLREKTETAASAWADKIATIDAHRDALRVPLPAGTRIVGVVVVPFPPFVLPGLATEPVADGLRRVSTVRELLVFLTGTTAAHPPPPG
ncbi:hypothetical protein ACGFJ5_20505 [Micromonospora echinaurantiaca]|uniref:hypothetical protein n=1 Tax=Micromonospora echinaurantiaca TaxID=47857 RepID=UPI0037171A7D